jgi:hypothetical protein
MLSATGHVDAGVPLLSLGPSLFTSTLQYSLKTRLTLPETPMKRCTAILYGPPFSGLASSSGVPCGNERNSGKDTRTLYHRFSINTRKSSYGRPGKGPIGSLSLHQLSQKKLPATPFYYLSWKGRCSSWPQRSRILDKTACGRYGADSHAGLSACMAELVN